MVYCWESSSKARVIKKNVNSKLEKWGVEDIKPLALYILTLYETKGLKIKVNDSVKLNMVVFGIMYCSAAYQC